MNEYMKFAAQAALQECLKLGRREKLLVVCDPPCSAIGQALWEVGRDRCKEAFLVQISPRKDNGNEPPEPVGEWFQQVDVAIMPTSKSLSHTKARRKASEKGVRIATLPGVTEDMFLRTMKTDWNALGAYTRKIAAQLSATEKVQIKTDAGTDIMFEIRGRQISVDDGRLNYKGAFGNLPAGEAYCAPVEGTAEGRIVFDGSFPMVGLLDEPLILEVRKGRVVSVSGHPAGKELETLFLRYKSPSRTIAEFGVGTLDTAMISGRILEDEKVRGTVHIAIGDNASMGGSVSVPIHLDGIIRQPSVWLDYALWMKDGALV
ncbi:MAG: aminopeptidase [Chitinivibrionales bacterium]|nr:aminopeptidase [Chitinivibrionales bacterium]